MKIIMLFILVIPGMAWAQDDSDARMKEAKAKWEARLNSPPELDRDICQRYLINKRLQENITSEKKAIATEKVSEQMTKNLEANQADFKKNQDFMNEKKAKYKKAAGKDWTPVACKY